MSPVVWLTLHPEFEVDRTHELGLLYTHHAWLRRKIDGTF